MTANQLADALDKAAEYLGMIGDADFRQAATMLRQQQAEISLLQEYVCQLESGLESSINLNKAQAERQAKTLTNEEILCLWDWWSGEILSTDILDFADTYKRALMGEEGLLEWHQEYVKRMNNETT
jgi:hypothetical protein